MFLNSLKLSAMHCGLLADFPTYSSLNANKILQTGLEVIITDYLLREVLESRKPKMFRV